MALLPVAGGRCFCSCSRRLLHPYWNYSTSPILLLHQIDHATRETGRCFPLFFHSRRSVVWAASSSSSSSSSVLGLFLHVTCASSISLRNTCACAVAAVSSATIFAGLPSLSSCNFSLGASASPASASAVIVFNSAAAIGKSSAICASTATRAAIKPVYISSSFFRGVRTPEAVLQTAGVWGSSSSCCCCCCYCTCDTSAAATTRSRTLLQDILGKRSLEARQPPMQQRYQQQQQRQMQIQQQHIKQQGFVEFRKRRSVFGHFRYLLLLPQQQQQVADTEQHTVIVQRRKHERNLLWGGNSSTTERKLWCTYTSGEAAAEYGTGRSKRFEDVSAKELHQQQRKSRGLHQQKLSSVLKGVFPSCYPSFIFRDMRCMYTALGGISSTQQANNIFSEKGRRVTVIPALPLERPPLERQLQQHLGLPWNVSPWHRLGVSGLVLTCHSSATAVAPLDRATWEQLLRQIDRLAPLLLPREILLVLRFLAAAAPPFLELRGTYDTLLHQLLVLPIHAFLLSKEAATAARPLSDIAAAAGQKLPASAATPGSHPATEEEKRDRCPRVGAAAEEKQDEIQKEEEDEEKEEDDGTTALERSMACYRTLRMKRRKHVTKVVTSDADMQNSGVHTPANAAAAASLLSNLYNALQQPILQQSSNAAAAALLIPRGKTLPATEAKRRFLLVAAVHRLTSLFVSLLPNGSTATSSSPPPHNSNSLKYPHSSCTSSTRNPASSSNSNSRARAAATASAPRKKMGGRGTTAAANKNNAARGAAAATGGGGRGGGGATAWPAAAHIRELLACYIQLQIPLPPVMNKQQHPSRRKKTKRATPAAAPSPLVDLPGVYQTATAPPGVNVAASASAAAALCSAAVAATPVPAAAPNTRVSTITADPVASVAASHSTTTTTAIAARLSPSTAVTPAADAGAAVAAPGPAAVAVGALRRPLLKLLGDYLTQHRMQEMNGKNMALILNAFIRCNNNSSTTYSSSSTHSSSSTTDSSSKCTPLSFVYPELRETDTQKSEPARIGGAPDSSSFSNHEQLFAACARRLPVVAAEMTPQQLALVANAFARAEHRSLAAFKSISVHAQRQLQHFHPQDFSNILNAYAKLGILEPQLFAAAAPLIAARVREFSPQHLANIAHAYGKAGHREEPLLLRIAEMSRRCMQNFTGQELGNLAHAYAKCCLHHRGLLASLADEVLYRCTVASSSSSRPVPAVPTTMPSLFLLGSTQQQQHLQGWHQRQQQEEKKIERQQREALDLLALQQLVSAFAKLGLRDHRVYYVMAQQAKQMLKRALAASRYFISSSSSSNSNSSNNSSLHPPTRSNSSTSNNSRSVASCGVMVREGKKPRMHMSVRWRLELEAAQRQQMMFLDGQVIAGLAHALGKSRTLVGDKGFQQILATCVLKLENRLSAASLAQLAAGCRLLQLKDARVKACLLRQLTSKRLEHFPPDSLVQLITSIAHLYLYDSPSLLRDAWKRARLFLKMYSTTQLAALLHALEKLRYRHLPLLQNMATALLARPYDIEAAATTEVRMLQHRHTVAVDASCVATNSPAAAMTSAAAGITSAAGGAPDKGRKSIWMATAAAEHPSALAAAFAKLGFEHPALYRLFFRILHAQQHTLTQSHATAALHALVLLDARHLLGVSSSSSSRSSRVSVPSSSNVVGYSSNAVGCSSKSTAVYKVERKNDLDNEEEEEKTSLFWNGCSFYAAISLVDALLCAAEREQQQLTAGSVGRLQVVDLYLLLLRPRLYALLPMKRRLFLSRVRAVDLAAADCFSLSSRLHKDISAAFIKVGLLHQCECQLGPFTLDLVLLLHSFPTVQQQQQQQQGAQLQVQQQQPQHDEMIQTHHSENTGEQQRKAQVLLENTAAENPTRQQQQQIQIRHNQEREIVVEVEEKQKDEQQQQPDGLRSIYTHERELLCIKHSDNSRDDTRGAGQHSCSESFSSDDKSCRDSRLTSTYLQRNGSSNGRASYHHNSGSNTVSSSPSNFTSIGTQSDNNTLSICSFTSSSNSSSSNSSNIISSSNSNNSSRSSSSTGCSRTGSSSKNSSWNPQSIGRHLRIAVEVEGPQHYYRDTCMRTATTFLKRQILFALGWKIVTIPYFEWNQLVTHERKLQYAASLWKPLLLALASVRQQQHDHLQQQLQHQHTITHAVGNTIVPAAEYTLDHTCTREDMSSLVTANIGAAGNASEKSAAIAVNSGMPPAKASPIPAADTSHIADDSLQGPPRVSDFLALLNEQGSATAAAITKKHWLQFLQRYQEIYVQQQRRTDTAAAAVASKTPHWNFYPQTEEEWKRMKGRLIESS